MQKKIKPKANDGYGGYFVRWKQKGEPRFVVEQSFGLDQLEQAKRCAKKHNTIVEKY